jgi:hypothetical protein
MHLEFLVKLDFLLGVRARHKMCHLRPLTKIQLNHAKPSLTKFTKSLILLKIQVNHAKPSSQQVEHTSR